MLKIKTFFKTLNVYSYISLGFCLIAFIICSFLFSNVYLRLWFSIVNCFESFIVYFKNVFHLDVDSMPINFYDHILLDDDLSKVYGLSYEFNFLPKDFEILSLWFKTANLIYINLSYFKNSYKFIEFVVKNLNLFVLCAVCLFLIYFMFDSIYFEPKDPLVRGYSSNLKKFLTFSEHFKFLGRWFNGFKELFVERTIVRKAYFLFFILFSYSASTIIETFSLCLIVLSSFRFDLVYPTIYGVLYTCYPLIKYVPFYVWVIIGWFIFDRIRKNKAIDKLCHFEHLNENFVNDLGVVCLVTGEPGSGKTTLIVDMGLTAEKNFRYKLNDIMCKYVAYFPYFDFSAFRHFIDVGVQKHLFFNKTTLCDYIDKISFKCLGSKSRKFLGYDSVKYGYFKYDELDLFTLFDVLKIYGSAYLLYKSKTPLMFSNLPIRNEYFCLSSDYYVSFYYDYFSSKADNFVEDSIYDHNIDLDGFRLGKKFDILKWAYEGGVFILTELDKERGNQFDKQGLKMDDFASNLLNDKFNRNIKLIRHATTIDHIPFFLFIGDLQRLGSLNVDLTELSEYIITIHRNQEKKSALFFFTLDSIYFDFICNFYSNFMVKYYRTRNNYSLLWFLMNKIFAPQVFYYNKLINLFSYKKLELELSNGSQNVEASVQNYYLSSKKIYSSRFATDCYFPFFEKTSRKVTLSQDESPTFKSLYPSFEELDQQNSFLIRDLKSYDSFNDNNKE